MRREFYLKHYDYSIGDTVYYVVGGDAVYSIKKSRIVGTKTRHSGFRIDNNPIFDYIVYQTEDGHLISQTIFGDKRDEMDPSFVFRTKDEAVQCVKDCLHKEIDQAKHALFDAQERLTAAERALKIYEKYGKK
jgi:hypothetical protein